MEIWIDLSCYMSIVYLIVFNWVPHKNERIKKLIWKISTSRATLVMKIITEFVRLVQHLMFWLFPQFMSLRNHWSFHLPGGGQLIIIKGRNYRLYASLLRIQYIWLKQLRSTLCLKVFEWNTHINSLLSKICDTGNSHQTIILLTCESMNWRLSNCHLSCFVRFKHKLTLCLQ